MPRYTIKVNAKVRNVRRVELSLCISLQDSVFCFVQQQINFIVIILQ